MKKNTLCNKSLNAWDMADYEDCNFYFHPDQQFWKKVLHKKANCPECGKELKLIQESKYLWVFPNHKRQYPDEVLGA